MLHCDPPSNDLLGSHCAKSGPRRTSRHRMATNSSTRAVPTTTWSVPASIWPLAWREPEHAIPRSASCGYAACRPGASDAACKHSRHARPSQTIRVGAPRGQDDARRKRADTLGVSYLACLLAALAARQPRWRNWPDHLARAHLGTQSCEECLRRNWPDHIARGVADPIIAKIAGGTGWTTSRARHPGGQNCEDVSPLGRHLRAQNCENVSDETGQTTSRAATRRPKLRGCLRRNWRDRLR